MSGAKQTATTLAKAEDFLGERWDRCLADTGTKMAGGFALGKERHTTLTFKTRTRRT